MAILESRFTAENFILDLDKSFIQANIKDLRDKAYYSYLIKPGEEFRIDLISYSIYGTVTLKWLLLYINNITDESMLKANLIIKYCLFSDITNILLRTMEEK